VSGGGKALRFAPQLPANWNQVEAENVAAGNSRFNLKLTRESGRLIVRITRRGKPNASTGPLRITVAPAFPLDARVSTVKVQGRTTQFATSRVGDLQRAEVTFDVNQEFVEVVYRYHEGTDVVINHEIPMPGAQSKGLRILRSRADQNALHLILEGIGGSTYALEVHSPHQLGEVAGATIEADRTSARLLVGFTGPANTYVRRELNIPLKRHKR
jgi:hypothetical protein